MKIYHMTIYYKSSLLSLRIACHLPGYVHVSLRRHPYLYLHEHAHTRTRTVFNNTNRGCWNDIHMNIDNVVFFNKHEDINSI